MFISSETCILGKPCLPFGKTVDVPDLGDDTGREHGPDSPDGFKSIGDIVSVYQRRTFISSP